MSSVSRTITTIQKGTQLGGGRFVVRRQLNEGATAVVYEAWDKQNDVPVALKVLRVANGKMVVKLKLLKREVECASSVVHENFVRLQDLFAVGYQIVLVWEFIDGMDLVDLLNQRRGKLPEEEAAFYLYQIAKGVAFMHAKGICHGDIKAENCMIEKDSKIAKIIDFGLSRRLESANTVGAGTPDYMCPETILAMYQKDIAVDGKAVDVWTMGILLYLLVTGTYPFEDAQNPNKTLRNVVRFRMTPLPRHVTHECAALIRSMLAFKPTERIHVQQILDNPWLVEKSRAFGGRLVFDSDFSKIFKQVSQMNSAKIIDESVKLKHDSLGRGKKLGRSSWKNFWKRFTPRLLETGIH